MVGLFCTVETVAATVGAEVGIVVTVSRSGCVSRNCSNARMMRRDIPTQTCIFFLEDSVRDRVSMIHTWIWRIRVIETAK